MKKLNNQKSRDLNIEKLTSEEMNQITGGRWVWHHYAKEWMWVTCGRSSSMDSVSACI